MKRRDVIRSIEAAGARNDQQAFMRLYTENRISFQVAREAFESGRRLAAYISKRDEVTQ